LEERSHRASANRAYICDHALPHDAIWADFARCASAAQVCFLVPTWPQRDQTRSTRAATGPSVAAKSVRGPVRACSSLHHSANAMPTNRPTRVATSNQGVWHKPDWCRVIVTRRQPRPWQETPWLPLLIRWSMVRVHHGSFSKPRFAGLLVSRSAPEGLQSPSRAVWPGACAPNVHVARCVVPKNLRKMAFLT
jgi:hypothetical protein